MHRSLAGLSLLILLVCAAVPATAAASPAIPYGHMAHGPASPGFEPQLVEPTHLWLPFVTSPFVLPDCPALAMPLRSIEVAARPGAGFQWPYFLYIPERLDTASALVIPNNTGTATNDYCYHRQRALETLHDYSPQADALGTLLLVPAFPRPKDETDGTIASQYLGRGTLEAHWQQSYPMLAREDLQLIAMIEDARARVGPGAMQGKVLLWGYSASGMFVSRFAVLHPDRVQAAAFGGHGWTTLPAESWQGLTLPYPYGAGDLPELMGRPADLAGFLSVPLYVYMGAQDVNGWALPWHVGRTASSTDYFRDFAQQFGSSSPELVNSAAGICAAMGCKARFVLYPDAGHQITRQMNVDVMDFLKSHSASR